MDDAHVARFLMQLAAYVAKLHERNRTGSRSGIDPRFGDDAVSWEDEGFARWMGWRGEEEQEREIRNVRNREKS